MKKKKYPTVHVPQAYNDNVDSSFQKLGFSALKELKCLTQNTNYNLVHSLFIVYINIL